MSNKDYQKKFSLSYTELIQISKNLCVVLTRDLSDLSIFGLTAASITNLSDLIEAFENSRTDLEYEGDVMIRTEAKNVFVDQVHDQMRFMNARVESAFGLNSTIYTTFRFANFYTLTDSELLDSFKRIIRMANQYITELTPYGVTPALITSLNTLAAGFSASIVDQEEAIDARRLAASKRLEDANEIYELVNNYSNFGKKFYSKSDPAKYEDYVIYTPSAGGLTAPKNFRFFRGSRIFTWDLVENATRYEVEMSLDQIEWIQVFYDSWNEIEVDVPDGFSYYRCRAHNSGGFGDFCEVLAIEYYRVLPAPQNFRLELVEGTPKKARCLCDAVPTAELYMTYVSVVNIGASPSEWTGAASNELPVVMNELVLGKRNYFSMQAQNEGQSSLKTDALYLDVVD